MRDRGEPRARPLRHAFARPVVERFDDRLLHALLGEVEVSDPAYEPGDKAAGVVAEDRAKLDRLGAIRDHASRRSASGLISIVPPAGHVLAIAIAASRSGTSMIT